ncbi:hypothetical protein BS50DRAFT_228303 [Corynespora cassiicola Philippines]|uniref:Uncharacterized protein n=1 Tax=Corynespora cassiicola Philippines TaxID=1448308 RepID=A0A2T2N2K1_CORCC|nr:hypothetical protein BS50DRAFT_228303 [Corynespora cassiicola Philippines]
MPCVAHPSLLHDASAIALRQSKTRPSCDTGTAATWPRLQRAGEPTLRRSYQRPRLGYVSAADSSPVPSLYAPPHDGTYLCARRADDNDDGPRATSFSDQERCAPSSKSLSDTTNASDALDIATPPQATAPQPPDSRHGHCGSRHSPVSTRARHCSSEGAYTRRYTSNLPGQTIADRSASEPACRPACTCTNTTTTRGKEKADRRRGSPRGSQAFEVERLAAAASASSPCTTLATGVSTLLREI